MFFVVVFFNYHQPFNKHLSIGLGDSLNLVLLLDGIAVRRVLSSVHELISKALSDGLDVTESRLSRL